MTRRNDDVLERYCYIIVHNDRGYWLIAQDVRVLLTKCMRPGPHGEFQDAYYMPDLQLWWDFPAFNPQLQSVGKRAKKASLGCVTNSDGFRLTPYLRPNNLDTALRAHERMRVELVADAGIVQSNRIYIEISWDGQWHEGDDEMARHPVVREVRRPRDADAR